MIREYQDGDFRYFHFLPEEAFALSQKGVTPDKLNTLPNYGRLWTQEVDGKIYAIFGILFLSSHCEVFVFRTYDYKKYAVGLARACKRLLREYKKEFIISIVDDTHELAQWCMFLGFQHVQRKGKKIMWIYGGRDGC